MLRGYSCFHSSLTYSDPIRSLCSTFAMNPPINERHDGFRYVNTTPGCDWQIQLRPPTLPSLERLTVLRWVYRGVLTLLLCSSFLKHTQHPHTQLSYSAFVGTNLTLIRILHIETTDYLHRHQFSDIQHPTSTSTASIYILPQQTARIYRYLHRPVEQNVCVKGSYDFHEKCKGSHISASNSHASSQRSKPRKR